MKPHRILKTFPGSQTGHDHHVFEKGSVRDLSDDLAAIAVKEGWAEPHDHALELPAMAALLEAAELPDGATAVEEKSAGAAPENKMKKAAPANKKKAD